MPLRRVRARTLFAQNGWITGVDEASGATYYYNEQTGQSQWEPPQATAAQAQNNIGVLSTVEGPRTGQLWRVEGLSGVSGLAFDYEEESLRIVYAMWGLQDDLPYKLSIGDEIVLSRWNMINQQLTVSRKQCLVKCLDDGTATLTSCGRGPTLFRGSSSGGHWVALQDGESLVLAESDQISLDCNDPDGAIFVVERQAQGESAMRQGGGQQGGYAQQGRQLQAQPQLPYPWEKLVDQNGAVYYSNPQTGEASWEPPR